MVKRLALLLASVVVLGSIAPRVEAADTPRLTVRAGYEGLVKPGAWMPVEIDVANSGADFSGEVQIQIAGLAGRGGFSRPPTLYTVPLDSPGRSEKRVSLDVFLPTADDKLSASLVSGQSVLAQQEVPLQRVSSTELLCGVASQNQSAFDFLPAIELSGRQRRARLAHLAVSDIPTRAQLLSPLDCLIVDNVSTAALTSQQKTALSGWVAAGGLLIAGGGPAWQKTLAPLPGQLLPVAIKGTAPVRSLDSLARLSGQPFADDGPWLASAAAVTDGSVVASQEDLPLLVVGQRGAGTVVYSALDLASEPLKGWTGTEYLWRSLLAYVPGAVNSTNVYARQYTGWGRPPRIGLTDFSALAPPDGTWLLFLLVGYAVVAGPLNFLVLWRARRLELSVVTLPVLLGLGGLLAFTGAQDRREGDVALSKLSIVRSWGSNGPSLTRGYVSVLSPAERTYQFRLGPDALLSGLFYPFPATQGDPGDWVLRVRQETEARVDGFHLNAGGLGTFTIDGATLSPAIASDLLVNDGQVVGTISNRGEQAWLDANLVVGGQVVKLGPLPAGGTVSVRQPLTANAPAGFRDLGAIVRQLDPPDESRPGHSAAALRDLTQAAFNTTLTSLSRVDLGPVTLIAWPERGPLAVTVEEARAAEMDSTLLIASLPVRFPRGRQLEIPGELIDARPLVAGQQSKVQADGISLAAGESLAYELQLPVSSQEFALDSLAFNVTGSTRTPRANRPVDLGTIVLYDWEAADWRELPIAFGENLLPDPGRFVSALGMVRFRYTFRPDPALRIPGVRFSHFDLVARGQAR